MTLIALLLLALLAGFLLYRELPLLPASVLWLGAWLVLGLLAPALHHPLLLVPLGLLLLLLNLRPLRARLISGRVMAQLARMMPRMSDTEREALDVGTTWWDRELFSGKPDWHWFQRTELPRLTTAEQAFLDNEVEQLCALLDEWQVVHELKDLPEAAWRFLKEKGFFGLIIPEEYGGRGFSPFAQSCVMTRLATRSLTGAVTAMVPNSLGPGELLLHYGTEAQKQQWLPRLADGREIPCFALTGAEAGSDAGAIPDTGIVCEGEYDGERVLGIRLTFAKRWITLAPVATVIGLAFRLHDPERLLGDAGREDYGITCALIPASHPGVRCGERHNPGAPFMNGPVSGEDVFIPVDWIIGGPDNAGRGWRMLMECLGAGRGISLPALATASGILSYRSVSAYARIREQFNTPVGRFEGVQEATAEIAGLTYSLEAMRHWVTLGLADGTPSVVSAIAKYHATEMMRVVLNHGMDVMGGRAIQLGPRNPLALPYQAIPIAITVEGANILTRSLMIFGQGAMRCHPYLFEELQLLGRADEPDARAAFDRLLFRHIGFTLSRVLRLKLLTLSAGRLAAMPPGVPARQLHWYRLLNRFSTALAVTADLSLLTLGGQIKTREMLSARLGDVLSQLFIASAVLKFHAAQPPQRGNDLHANYALHRALYLAQEALLGFYRNVPVPGLGPLLRALVFPLGRLLPPLPDAEVAALGEAFLEPGKVRDTLSRYCHITTDEGDAFGRLEATWEALLAVEGPWRKLRKAVSRGTIVSTTFEEQLQEGVRLGLFDAAACDGLRHYERLRRDCLLTDVFDSALTQVTGAA